jgi:hypothetical protein
MQVRNYRVTRQIESSSPQSAQRFVPEAFGGGQCGQDERVMVCYEAGRCGGYKRSAAASYCKGEWRCAGAGGAPAPGSALRQWQVGDRAAGELKLLLELAEKEVRQIEVQMRCPIAVEPRPWGRGRYRPKPRGLEY